ncbi:excinuclease ABC subunit A [Candidatus Wolfebacteria bacterium RIFCSPLOWO2_01_FULL_38_11]|uniref:UvrABC system protein A n=2 Tax=Candidatus Wolfeibacteriota TaxID=1752735 RepID=A0A0G0FWN1_9BACT|nr:MAG: Excinuclease ABC, subunit A [Candidatus Wolfebacteria bacterium GW2011_GWC1_37_10]OGM90363.1 MAG: excinuclease ABC subunit A [Candidatus Wolfebacteria bacterium RIFCSPLOWO2_01_FULL_38_11]
MEDKIIIKGARVHNLQNIDLELPKNKMIVFTGVSGSGKSSLAFDTIFAEGQRRYIESLSPYARQFLGQMDRPDVDEIIGLSPAIAIDQKALSHNPRSIVGTLTEIYDYLRVLYARLGEVYCPKCGSKIKKLSLEEMVDIVVAKAKSLKEETVVIFAPVVRGRKGEYYQLLYDFLSLGFREARIDGKIHSLHEKIELSRYKPHDIEIVIDEVMIKDESRLFEAVESALNHSKGLMLANFTKEELLLSSKWTCPNDNFSFPEVEPRLFSFNSPYGACEDCSGLGKSDLFLKTICPVCHGKRLKPEALAVKIKNKNIWELSSLTIDKIYEFFIDYEAKLSEREKKIASNILKEIIGRLSFLLEVGLNYLSLDREAETLSGGEAQRIRLASQIGSQLSGTLYVLDEPTIGLHERDTERLIKTLKSLKDQKNTLIVVEHDEKTIFESDYFVDLGPLAGKNGGRVVAFGKTGELIKNPKKFKESLTLKYLSNEKKIELPEIRRSKSAEKIKIIGARANNLKNIDVEIPLRRLVCLTGVSGSGKSSLLYDVLYKNLSNLKAGFSEMENASRILGTEYIDKVVMVDQSPIGRTPRSNPATYTGIFTPIREFYASLEESRAKGYTASRFSFNVVGGRCEACQGAGFNLIEMHFLPPVLVQCDVCRAKRFNRETLQVKHKNKNIHDILEMRVDEALEFFDGLYTITDKLKVLQEVGLGYLQLGQSATTLSGGEAQRIKLARELTHPLGRRALYLLDEPTVGLHYYDIEMLLKVFNKLIEKGNTVIVIEHNMQIIKSADYIIDLGPEGGDLGGKIVTKGLPEEIVQNKNSYTGAYLKRYLV